MSSLLFCNLAADVLMFDGLSEQRDHPCGLSLLLCCSSLLSSPPDSGIFCWRPRFKTRRRIFFFFLIIHYFILHFFPPENVKILFPEFLLNFFKHNFHSNLFLLRCFRTKSGLRDQATEGNWAEICRAASLMWKRLEWPPNEEAWPDSWYLR